MNRRREMWTIAGTLLLEFSLGLPLTVRAQGHEPELWGVAIGLRSAQAPYVSEDGRSDDLIPLLFFDDGGRFFLRGVEAGFRLFRGDAAELNVISRYRYLDIPPDDQRRVKGNAFDGGVQLRFRASSRLTLDLEALDDRSGRTHASLTGSCLQAGSRWDLTSYARLRWKSGRFNRYYYGLDVESPGRGVDMEVGVDARYQVASNFHLFGRASVTLLEKGVTDLEVVDRGIQNELYLGIALFNDRNTIGRPLRSRPFVRISHGWATPSDLGEILLFSSESDPHDNRLSSVSFGIPLSDTLLGYPVSLYFTPGFIYHHPSDVQGRFPEYVLGVKAYYTFGFPVPVRIGLAEGISYTARISYIERGDVEETADRPSNLLNYLDLSVGVDLGRLSGSRVLEGTWLGVGVHHRSGIFESSSVFGGTRGGSNYQTLYLQYHW